MSNSGNLMFVAYLQHIDVKHQQEKKHKNNVIKVCKMSVDAITNVTKSATI